MAHPIIHTLVDESPTRHTRYLLGFAATAGDVEALLRNGTLTPHGPSIAGGDHFVVRDATGVSLVVEFLGGVVQYTRDLNDGGVTGFGIMTNDPPIGWQVGNGN